MQNQSNADQVHIILLAAGASERFGSIKQVAPVNGTPMLRRSATQGLQAGVPVWVITGAHRDAVENCIRDLPLHRLHHPEWAKGMGRSIAAAFTALIAAKNSPPAAIIALADQIGITGTDYQKLIAAHHTQPQMIIAADYGERRGPPCLFPSAYFKHLAALNGDQGARKLLQQHSSAVIPIHMPQAAADVDTPADLNRFSDRWKTPAAP